MSIFATITLVGAWLLGNISRFSFFSPDVRILPLDGVIFLLTLSAALLFRRRWWVSLRSHSLTRPVLVFSAISLISLLVSGLGYGLTALVVGGFYWGRWLTYSLLFASIIQLIKVETIPRLLLLLGISTAAVSWGQYLVLPDIRHLQAVGWDPHYYRVVGTLLDPGYTGIILVLFLVYLTVRMLNHNSIFHEVLWLFTYGTLALTYSRSSYLAFLVSQAFLSWQKRSAKLFIFSVLLLTATVYFLPRPGGEGVKLERTSTVSARLSSWKNSLTIFRDHPWLGVGFNTYRYAQNQYGFLDQSEWLASHAGAGADSSLLFVAATTGVIGLAAYLWYLSRLFSLPALRYYLPALLIHSLFLNSLFYPFVMVWLSLLVLCGSGSPPGRRQ